MNREAAAFDDVNGSTFESDPAHHGTLARVVLDRGDEHRVFTDPHVDLTFGDGLGSRGEAEPAVLAVSSLSVR